MFTVTCSVVHKEKGRLSEGKRERERETERQNDQSGRLWQEWIALWCLDWLTQQPWLQLLTLFHSIHRVKRKREEAPNEGRKGERELVKWDLSRTLSGGSLQVNCQHPLFDGARNEWVKEREKERMWKLEQNNQRPKYCHSRRKRRGRIPNNGEMVIWNHWQFGKWETHYMLQSQYTSNTGHLLDSLTGLFSPVDYKCPKCPVHCMCYVCSGRKWLFPIAKREAEWARERESKERKIQLNHWIRFLRLDWRLILWSAHTSLWLWVKKKEKNPCHTETYIHIGTK